ncbi:MAG: phosphotransferase [Chloroflexi bacterium]|nr:phosphotransferase [Chloroflexota bacterium]OJW06472.1 MAG: hypothetical protein BGO39_00185 [Chloroflexi bacterium 54-19]
MAGDKLARYRAAIEENFPGFALEKLVYLAEGWGNVALLANDLVIFRFPKRPDDAARLALETRLLPELAPRLPLTIPNFTFISKPASKNYPYLFGGYEMLPGLFQADWPTEAIAADWWKQPVGDFLTALHAFPRQRAAELGASFINFAGTTSSYHSWREAVEDFYTVVRRLVYPLLSEERQDLVADYFEDFLDTGRFFEFEPVLLHGDLSEDHILGDPARRQVTGIIDFGDLCLGDPAFDVSPAVLPFYHGHLDPTFAERQSFYGKLAPFIAAVFGLDHSDPALVEYGLGLINSDGFLS